MVLMYQLKTVAIAPDSLLSEIKINEFLNHKNGNSALGLGKKA